MDRYIHSHLINISLFTLSNDLSFKRIVCLYAHNVYLKIYILFCGGRGGNVVWMHGYMCTCLMCAHAFFPGPEPRGSIQLQKIGYVAP